MSTAILPREVKVALLPTSVPSKPSARTWLIGPVFDLLFVANLTWPLVAVMAFYAIGWLRAELASACQMVSVSLSSADALSWCTDPFSLFQIYFLATAHRWITLVLVFFDREHFWKQKRKFGGLAVLLTALAFGLVGLAQIWPGMQNPLMILLAVDFIWNSWHFAAQHAGISRIYGRMAHPDMPVRSMNFEKMAI